MGSVVKHGGARRSVTEVVDDVATHRMGFLYQDTQVNIMNTSGVYSSSSSETELEIVVTICALVTVPDLEP